MVGQLSKQYVLTKYAVKASFDRGGSQLAFQLDAIVKNVFLEPFYSYMQETFFYMSFDSCRDFPKQSQSAPFGAVQAIDRK